MVVEKTSHHNCAIRLRVTRMTQPPLTPKSRSYHPGHSKSNDTVVMRYLFYKWEQWVWNLRIRLGEVGMFQLGNGHIPWTLITMKNGLEEALDNQGYQCYISSVNQFACLLDLSKISSLCAYICYFFETYNHNLGTFKISPQHNVNESKRKSKLHLKVRKKIINLFLM